MLKFALVLLFVSLARGQNANGQSQVQQYSGGSEPYAFGQNQSPYAQSQNGQAQSALAGQTMPGMTQTPGGIGQWQNPYVNYYQNQGLAAPMGGPMMQEGRRFLGGYAVGPAVMGPPVMGPPMYGGVIGAPIGVGMGYPYYRK